VRTDAGVGAAMEQEFAAVHQTNSWSLLYEQICNESRNHHPAVEALKVENKQLNRYRDVYPYDHSRVPLVGVEGTDYINASLVRCAKVSRSYILTQGPLAATVPHFWAMVWQQQSKAVIMLNRIVEKGTLKCFQYWPPQQGDSLTCDAVGLTVTNVTTEPGEHYNVSTLRMTHLESEESRDVLHFHYTTWPDFGVPSCPDKFLQFLGAVRESGSLSLGVGPAIVHCSAGIGRSGTFVLVDTCLLEAETQGKDTVNVKDRLLDMRTQRMGLIQTYDQLKFSYLSIMEGARQLGLVDSVPVYDPPVAEASDSSSEDDVPPPLPPPRTESLKKEAIEVVLLGDRAVTLEDKEPYEPAATAAHAHNKVCDAMGAHNNLPAQLESLVNGHVESESSSHASLSGAESFGSTGSGGSTSCSPPDSGAGSANQSGTGSGAASSGDGSPNKNIILTEHKLEERKREMELKRRKKKEETSTTEKKIAEMKKEIRSAEEWSARKEYWRQTVLPFCVGLLICAAGLYNYNLRSS